MFECYTMLSARWRSTRGRCVSRPWSRATPTGTRRLLAKTITTLDHVSHVVARPWASARAGSSSSTTPSASRFGTFGERFEKLEEALKIIQPLLNAERRASLEGKHYQVTSTPMNSPAPVSQASRS